MITQKQYQILKSVVNNEQIDYKNNIDTIDALAKHNLINRFRDCINKNENTEIAIEEYERYLSSAERDERNIRISEYSNKIAVAAAIVGSIGLLISLASLFISIFA